jgi:integrase
VFYSFRNPATGKMVRFRIYEGFADCKTKEEKTQHGMEICSKLRAKLQNGWSPFEEDQKVIYEDSLQYHDVAKKYGRMRNANRRFHFFCNKWLNEHVGIRPATYTNYKSKLRYFNFFLEERGYHENDISEFTVENAREFNMYLKKRRKLSNKSINEYNVLLKSFFKYMVEEKHLKINCFAGFKPLKTEPKKPRIFTKELMQRIAKDAAENDPQLYMVIRIIYNCFIRPNEIRQLRISDIDFSRGKIIVPARVAKDKEERNVDIPIYLLDYMLEIKLNKAPVGFYLLSEDEKPGPYMAGRNYMYRRFVALKKRLGIPKEYQLYAFKYTGMVETKLSGADWLDIRNQAGHESLDQTIEYTTALMAQGSKHIRENGPRI